MAELPQKSAVEKAFAGMRDLFSSVFFVSIGMMIEVRLMLDVWPAVLGLGVFVLVGRAFALSSALILCGTPPREARRAGLLLGPLGEFSFIIAQLGVSAAVLPPAYYPLSVGVSIFTVLAVPLINRFADPLLAFADKAEPSWLRRAIEAYHVWLGQLQNNPKSSVAWRLIRGRLVQIALEVLFVTGVMIFSPRVFQLIAKFSDSFGLAPRTLSLAYWGVITVLTLIPLVAVWRNLAVVTMIYAESVAHARMPLGLVRNVLQSFAALALAFWLYAIIPLDQLSSWGWLVMGVFAVLVITVYSRKLVFWHSEWDASVRSVLADKSGDTPAGDLGGARGPRLQKQGLQGWDVKLSDCIVPDSAAYAGQSLAQLSIPSRFGCVILEIERNGIVITALNPDLRIYPGDKLLLMGEEAQIEAAREALSREQHRPSDTDAFRGSILETLEIPDGPWSGRTLSELNIGQLTGTRIVGVHRHDQRIIAPSGQEKLHAGDNVLVAGTLAEIAAFRRWLKNTPASA